MLVDGIFRVIGAIGHRASDPDWGWQLVIGILGIIIGFLTFHAPGITALALVIYIAAWALMIGVTEIALAIKLRHEIKGEWLLIVMGVASILFAVLLLWNPFPVRWRSCGSSGPTRSCSECWRLFWAFACAACRHCPPADPQQTVRDFCNSGRQTVLSSPKQLGRRARFCATKPVAAGLSKKNAASSD